MSSTGKELKLFLIYAIILMDISTSETRIRNNFCNLQCVSFFAYVLKLWKSLTDLAHYNTLGFWEKTIVISSIEEQQTCVYGAWPGTRIESTEM